MFFMMMARTESADKEPLLAWLCEHQEEVLSGVASYNGQRITSETKLARYTSVLSFLFITFRKRASWVLADDEQASREAMRCSLLTAILGWWSLYGLFYAPAALLMNLTGGQTKTVVKIYEDLKYGKMSEPFDMRPLVGALALPAVFVLFEIALSFTRFVHA